MDKLPQEHSTPTGPSKSVPGKRKSPGRVATFVLGIVVGLGIVIAWPKLAPLTTCLRDIAQNEFPVPTGTEGDEEWIKVYGKMTPTEKWDRVFGPTYNQLMDFYFKFRRPIPPYPNASQEAKDAYPKKLEEWKQRMCKFGGLCAAQADTSGAATPSYPDDIPKGFHVEQLGEQ